MSLHELIEIQDKLEEKLLGDDFSFIGPEDQNLLEAFFRNVNHFAPIVSLERKFEDFLGNKEAVLSAIPYLPIGSKLRIYVIDGNSDSILLHDTVENYCKQNNIVL